MDSAKIAQKRLQLVQRTALALSVSDDQAVALLQQPRQQSLRYNPLQAGSKPATLARLRELGWLGEPVSWSPDCYNISSGLEAVRDSPAARSGQVYIQNAASWLPVLALDPHPGETILDVCAAPGGKTSHLAALSGNQASITTNDNSRVRLTKLRANLERLGVDNVHYSLYEASRLSYKLTGQQFDKILLDAPCSGEGMLQFTEDRDFQYWSVAQIKRLSQLQKKIIAQAWRLLRPGGTLVYSTCTMAPEENEAVIDYLLRHNDDAQPLPLGDLALGLTNVSQPVLNWNQKAYDLRLQAALRLYPSQDVEAFFVCKLTKALDSLE